MRLKLQQHVPLQNNAQQETGMQRQRLNNPHRALDNIKNDRPVVPYILFCLFDRQAIPEDVTFSCVKASLPSWSARRCRCGRPTMPRQSPL